MTKKEFRNSMVRGLGRCVIAVRKEPEKYRDEVLWACQRNIAYDAQSEGTRSWYVYSMVKAYPDQEPMIHVAAEALRKYRPNSGWDLLHLSELLMFFAMDGSEPARRAVEEKYQELLADIHQRKHRPNGLFPELSDLEQLGLVLSTDRIAFLRIAADFGRLYREKTFLREGDFDWFFGSKGAQYKKALHCAAKKDPNTACFLQKEQAYIEESSRLWENRRKMSPGNLTGSRLSKWLANTADTETVNGYAAAYREQSQAELRAQALEAFCLCPYPGDPQPIIEDTHSSCEKLRNAAWNALGNVRHPSVRSFALSQAAAGIRTLENFELLVTNYLPRDSALLERILCEQIDRKDWDGVHSAGMSIYKAFYKGSGIPHPKHLLLLLYEFNPCSYCRKTALRYLARHRMLTQQILEECLYDSSSDIRQMARKKLNK